MEKQPGNTKNRSEVIKEGETLLNEYTKLFTKFKEGTLSPEEAKRMTDLSAEIEKLVAERLK